MLLFTAHTRDTVHFFFLFIIYKIFFFAWHSADFVFIIYKKNFFAISKMIMLCSVHAEIHLKNQKHI